MAHDVFISYSNKDKTTADAICAALEVNGIRCWIAPRDILPGSDWGEAIIDAIHACRAMLLIFSSNSNASAQIKREVERSVNAGIPVVPVRIEDVMPSKTLEYFISTQHWLDALTPPMEQHLQYLVTTMRAMLAQKPDGSEASVREPQLKPPPAATAVTPPPAAAAPALGAGAGRQFAGTEICLAGGHWPPGPGGGRGNGGRGALAARGSPGGAAGGGKGRRKNLSPPARFPPRRNRKIKPRPLWTLPSSPRPPRISSKKSRSSARPSICRQPPRISPIFMKCGENTIFKTRITTKPLMT